MEKTPRLRGWASPFVYPTGLFIRGYLLEHGEGYAQEMWRQLKKAREGRHVCTCDSFKRNYVYTLKKLGLIEERLGGAFSSIQPYAQTHRR